MAISEGAEIQAAFRRRRHQAWSTAISWRNDSVNSATGSCGKVSARRNVAARAVGIGTEGPDRAVGMPIGLDAPKISRP